MITSAQNPKIKDIRHLQSRTKARQQRGAFVIEGIRLVEEAIQQQWLPELVIYTDTLDDRGLAAVHLFQDQEVPTYLVSVDVFQAASDTETPQGILAVVPIPKPEIQHPVDFVIITEGLRDPGNLGTILRSAVAAGVDVALIPPGTVDVYSPKVIRAGMGAHFHLSVKTPSWEEVGKQLQGMTTFTADAHHGTPCWNANFNQPVALMISSEAHGPGEHANALTDVWVHIPMLGKAESLNAGVALSVLMFEVVRQRYHSLNNSGKP